MLALPATSGTIRCFRAGSSWTSRRDCHTGRLKTLLKPWPVESCPKGVFSYHPVSVVWAANKFRLVPPQESECGLEDGNCTRGRPFLSRPRPLSPEDTQIVMPRMAASSKFTSIAWKNPDGKVSSYVPQLQETTVGLLRVSFKSSTKARYLPEAVLGAK